MSVFVTMTVRPPDAGKFEAACKQAFSVGLPPGCTSQFWGRLDSDPGTYIVGGNWESHDAMHDFSEKTGDDFNRDAGTEGVEWETKVFQVMG